MKMPCKYTGMPGNRRDQFTQSTFCSFLIFMSVAMKLLSLLRRSIYQVPSLRGVQQSGQNE